MPTRTSGQRSDGGRSAPGVPVSVRQVREVVTLHAHAWLAFGLIGVLIFGLRAFGEGAPSDGASRFVEVRAAGRLLAENAVLLDD
ncbi:MAG: hypothetical protein AAF543_17335, partial [Pseudomonadota bacterium]